VEEWFKRGGGVRLKGTGPLSPKKVGRAKQPQKKKKACTLLAGTGLTFREKKKRKDQKGSEKKIFQPRKSRPKGAYKGIGKLQGLNGGGTTS